MGDVSGSVAMAVEEEAEALATLSMPRRRR